METGATLTPNQQNMADIWDKHTSSEFQTQSVEETLETMTDEPCVNHVPVMTGGTGLAEVRRFYSERFIPQQPPDTEISPVSRTIGDDRLVDEMIFKFTHTVAMDWMLPGVPPTGKRVEVPLVVAVGFEEGKIASESIYWDQASVLAQIGLLDPETLPVAGIETSHKLLDPGLPSNELIERADRRV